MTTWHQVRRLIAAATAGVVAAASQQAGLPFLWAVVFGIACAIVVAGLLIPLLWKPPKR